jgi:site-specific DNA-methyltransferase (adenine-specific)|tara:strand:- start:156 stop:794 length:639 start_codon:yes stop_codon:yes gene_type:complete
MKPYYQDEWVTIYHGDCREILPSLPKVDLVLTDPPYGNNTEYGTYDDTEYNLRRLVGEVMPLIMDKSDRSLITCGVANIGLYPKPEWILSWVTPAGNGSGKWGFCCWQPILAYGGDPYLANGMGRRPDIIIKTESTKIKSHPCSKPIDIWQLILLRGSVKETDTILDPFLGSGTTTEAARKLNRKCIGIEIEEKYCEIAAKRCSQSVMRLEL